MMHGWQRSSHLFPPHDSYPGLPGSLSALTAAMQPRFQSTCERMLTKAIGTVEAHAAPTSPFRRGVISSVPSSTNQYGPSRCGPVRGPAGCPMRRDQMSGLECFSFQQYRRPRVRLMPGAELPSARKKRRTMPALGLTSRPSG